MMQPHHQNVTKPGVWATISAGFELTTRHLWLILIPIILDSFFWLGPRLSLRMLVEQAAAVWRQTEALADVANQMAALAPDLNLFTALAVPWIGVPTLMSGLVTPPETPLMPAVIELQSAGEVGLWFILLTMVGLFLSVLFLLLVARVVGLREDGGKRPFFLRLGDAWLRLFLMGIALAVLIVLIYVPVGMVSVVASLISPLLGLVTLLVVPVIVLWFVIAVYFMPQGVLLDGQTLRQAMRSSLTLLQQESSTSLSMILAVMLLGALARQVLVILDDGSWVTTVNIVAHAFIRTALTMATFIFYRDRVAVTQVRPGS